MKEHHREGRHREERHKESRDDRHKDDRDDRRKDSRDDRRRNEDRRREDREDKNGKDKRGKDDWDHRFKRRHRSSSREPKEKRYRRDDVDKSPTAERRADKPVGGLNEEEAGGAAEKLSLSIEETNKLRAKLGLKPLSRDESKDITMTATDKPDVHVPAINIGEVKRREALKEKLQVIKEKRRLEESLFKASPLGQVAEEESIAEWVERNRVESAKKKQEEAKAKAIDELSKEFGIGGLVEQEFAGNKKTYRASDLKGLKIEHNVDSFKEGRDVILTLKDKGVLEDGEDVLVNVNMIDDEKALVNVENKKNKPAYNPYDDPEFDDLGVLKEKTVLSKYDDEIRGGPMKDSFIIGNKGVKMSAEAAAMKAVSESLNLPELAPVSDYYTPAEIASFKKSNKKMKKNVRKKVKLTADELLSGVQSNEVKQESEESKIVVGDSVANDQPDLPSLDEIESSLRRKYDDDDDDDDNLGMDRDVSAIDDRDWLEAELENKRRKVKLENVNLDDIVVQIKSEPVENDSAEPTGNTFYMNSTAEFCRSLGDFMTSSSGPNPFKDEDYDEMEADQNENDDSSHQGWKSVEIDEKPIETKIEENHVLDEEPIIDHGLGAALKLASKKGYLDSLTMRQIAASKQTSLESQNYSIEDKRMDDLDDKYSSRRSKYSSSGGGGGGGPIVEFKEKHGYKPEIKLEYVDDHGREMSKKEAFRYLSHKFHGKGSGKKKLEKRMKKAEEDTLMRSMSSTDTPLNTAQLLQDKQKANKVPYVVLSGGKGLVTNIITK